MESWQDIQTIFGTNNQSNKNYCKLRVRPWIPPPYKVTSRYMKNLVIGLLKKRLKISTQNLLVIVPWQRAQYIALSRKNPKTSYESYLHINIWCKPYRSETQEPEVTETWSLLIWDPWLLNLKIRSRSNFKVTLEIFIFSCYRISSEMVKNCWWNILAKMFSMSRTTFNTFGSKSSDESFLSYCPWFVIFYSFRLISRKP